MFHGLAAASDGIRVEISESMVSESMVSELMVSEAMVSERPPRPPTGFTGREATDIRGSCAGPRPRRPPGRLVGGGHSFSP